MSFAKPSAKPRLQRLRASCDVCFLAKVRCSKVRPVCSRCLSCGTDCKYSPSSRAGKPRANRQTSTSNTKASIANNDIIIDEVLHSPFLFDSQAISMPLDGNNSPMFAFDTNWSIPSDSVDGSRQRSSSANTTPSLREDTLLDTIEMGLTSSTTEFFDPSFAWTATPPNELPSPAFPTGHGMALPRSRSLGDVPHLNSFSSWFGNQHSALPFSPSTNADITSPNGFFGSSPPSDRTSSSKASSSTCNCFTTCLQSLQALHNHSSATQLVPAFDVILTVNRKAVEGCANMLACSKCISKSGSNTTSMLLATIFEKIMSFYRTASQSNFGAMSGVETQMSIGSYQVANEDGCWLRIEILWRELRKLEELFSRFREACGVEVVEAVEGPGVHSALMGHLSQSLNFTVEVLKMHQHSFKRME